MILSQDGVRLIKRFEGVKYTPYRCPAKLWTVGVGSLMYPEQLQMSITERMKYCLKPEHFRQFTEEEVDELFTRDVRRFERGVERLITAPLTQGQFDSLVSFGFNLGLGALQRSTLRQKINRGNYESASGEFTRWVRAGGKVLRGLVLRRQAEQAMFNM